MRSPQIGFPQLVQDFFVRRLVAQRGASARTVEAYRDAFELLLSFAEQHTGKPPSALSLADLDAPLVLDFLDHLETERGNTARTRNARLAAIHSFMRYAALRDPAALPVTARVLAIPAKRFDKPVLGYLSREQVTAILAAPDQRTWTGRRDAALLATGYNTGARVSELTALRVRDVLLDRQTAVHLHGKGRKQRVIPLWKTTAAQLRAWLDQISSEPAAPVFPNRGRPSADPLRHPRPARPGGDRRRAALPVPARPARHAAHAAALHRHAPAAIGHGPRGHRPLARARKPGHNAPVPRSRPRCQGSRPATADRPWTGTNTIPARRPAPRIPARPLIMCSHTTAIHPAGRGPPAAQHITPA